MNNKTPTPSRPLLTVGRIGRPHGVQGWTRIISFTEPLESIFTYNPWYLLSTSKGARWQTVQQLNHRISGKHLIAKIEGYDDLDSVKMLTHSTLAIEHSQLTPLNEGEYYWADIEQLKVMTLQGDVLGWVDHVFETGSNDVLCVKDAENNTYLIPYIDAAIKTIDRVQACVVVEKDYVIPDRKTKKPST